MYGLSRGSRLSFCTDWAMFTAESPMRSRSFVIFIAAIRNLRSLAAGCCRTSNA